MMLPVTFTSKYMHVVYELNEAFYTLGMDQPTCHNCDAWWNLSCI